MENFASNLANSTPTKRELREREKQAHIDRLQTCSYQAVEALKKICKKYADAGSRSCWTYAASLDITESPQGWELFAYWTETGRSEDRLTRMFTQNNLIDRKDAALFVSMLEKRIDALGFKRYRIQEKTYRCVTRPGALLKHRIGCAKLFKITVEW